MHDQEMTSMLKHLGIECIEGNITPSQIIQLMLTQTNKLLLYESTQFSQTTYHFAHFFITRDKNLPSLNNQTATCKTSNSKPAYHVH